MGCEQYNNISDMSLKMIWLLSFAGLWLAMGASSIKEPISLAVTIYNDQFAMVKDTRSITFDQGRSDLFFTDVSSNIQTETVTFKALTETENIKVFQQNFEANLINKESILKKYIDQNIEVSAKFGDKSVRIAGVLLGYSNGYILKTKTGIEVLNNIDGISFSSLPSGFFTLPTLNWKVFSKNAVTANCQVAYRTTGFSWKSDYLITLDEQEVHADVGGWVTITNKSGKKYENAKLKLIAGDVNTVQPPRPVPRPIAMAMKKGGGNYAPTFSEKSFSDYHLYTLSNPVTLNDNSQKQVEFIPKVYKVTVRKYNLVPINAGGFIEQNIKARNRIQLINNKANGLGLPLPKGTVRVFKTDKADGSLEFIGQDSINHTPKDQKITVTTGNAFDITSNKLASNYRSYNNGGYSADLNLTIFNHKSIAAEIVVEIANMRGDNVKFIWTTQNLQIEKVSSALLRIKKRFEANQKFSILWVEDYRP